MSRRVMVNGQPRTYPDGTTISTVVAGLLPGTRSSGVLPTGVAVAVNDVVVARTRWADERIDTADRIEIVTAIQGG